MGWVGRLWRKEGRDSRSRHLKGTLGSNMEDAERTKRKLGQ